MNFPILASSWPFLINQFENMRRTFDRPLGVNLSPKFPGHVRLARRVIFFEKWLQFSSRQDHSRQQDGVFPLFGHGVPAALGLNCGRGRRRDSTPKQKCLTASKKENGERQCSPFVVCSDLDVFAVLRFHVDVQLLSGLKFLRLALRH
jgi:hypothetical protein